MKRLLLGVAFAAVAFLGVPRDVKASSCADIPDGWGCLVGDSCAADDCQDTCNDCCEDEYGLPGTPEDANCSADDPNFPSLGHCYCDCLCAEG